VAAVLVTGPSSAPGHLGRDRIPVGREVAGAVRG
jgi:hypothetical protein